jgi:hypothetical protein
MHLIWKRFDFDSIEGALSQSFCLYAFHHPQDGDRPFYIGKAKYFGTKQPAHYERSARYNSGYLHLLVGMLRSGFSLYIAPIGELAYTDAESYEQELIKQWNPIRNKKITTKCKVLVTKKPWNDT